MLHREPAIELCGADLHKFAELRGLGLVNEQIDWKQRFFVPTDEEKGIAVLDSLLARYPIVPTAASGESAIGCSEPQESTTPQIVNLDEWFISAGETVVVSSIAPDESDSAEPMPSLSALYVLSATAGRVLEPQLALDFG